MAIPRLSSLKTLAVPTLTAALALGGLVSACDGDNTANQTGDAGNSGAAAGKGGATGVAGSSAGAAGTAGGSVVAGAGGGAVAGSGGGAAGAAGGVAFIDTDVFLARFNADGTPDPAYGTAGVARVDLGPGALVGTSSVRDAPWGIAADAENRVLVFSARKATGAGRVDSDRVVARVTTTGALDTTFGDAATAPARTGVHTLAIGTLGENARNGRVDRDGKIVTAGYINFPTGVGTQTANQPALVRLNGGNATAGAGGAGGGAAAPIPGTFDMSFGVNGVATRNPFATTDGVTLFGMAEAYGLARQSTGGYITTGYGRTASSGQVNVVCFRWSAAGVFDTTFGTAGIFEKDLTSNNDRGRNIVALPDDRLLIAGSAEQAAGDVDGMIMILTPNGALDTTFNTTGYKIYKFDATNARPDESLYGAAVSPNGQFAAVVGYQTANANVATTNEDAVLVIIPLGGTGTEFAAAVPFSDTANDRFWGVTFDESNKIVAAGVERVGSDNYMAVARFNTDGSRDLTFGGGTGKARINAAVGTNLEEARGVIVQTDGKIVLGGSGEH